MLAMKRRIKQAGSSPDLYWHRLCGYDLYLMWYGRTPATPRGKSHIPGEARDVSLSVPIMRPGHVNAIRAEVISQRQGKAAAGVSDGGGGSRRSRRLKKV